MMRIAVASPKRTRIGSRGVARAVDERDDRGGEQRQDDRVRELPEEPPHPVRPRRRRELVAPVAEDSPRVLVAREPVLRVRAEPLDERVDFLGVSDCDDGLTLRDRW